MSWGVVKKENSTRVLGSRQSNDTNARDIFVGNFLGSDSIRIFLMFSDK